MAHVENNHKEHRDNGKEHHDNHDNRKEKVTITINNTAYEVHRGHHTVAELKALDQIPPANELNIIIDNNFSPLPDDGGVAIKGGEEFISNARDGVSS